MGAISSVMGCWKRALKSLLWWKKGWWDRSPRERRGLGAGNQPIKRENRDSVERGMCSANARGRVDGMIAIKIGVTRLWTERGHTLSSFIQVPDTSV
jgi:hypothetical protein